MTVRRMRAGVAAIAVAMAVILLSACGGESAPLSATPTPSPMATTVTTATAEPTPEATATVKPAPEATATPEPASSDATPACSNGIAVPDPEDNPGLVRDCAVLLEARDILAGDGNRNPPRWRDDRAIQHWPGVSVNVYPARVSHLVVTGGLRGRIPSELGLLNQLRTLDLRGNRLTSEIPPELGSLTKLEELYLAHNDLTGEIPPELGQLKNLEHLDLRDNRLAGEVPPELGALTKLRELYLADNELTGPIPRELPQLPKLEYLEMNGNQLTGGIPGESGEWVNLRVLDLRDNRLTGGIPAALANIHVDEFWGANVWLGGNQWTGCLPLALRPLLIATDYGYAGDLRDLGLRYCQCPSRPERVPSPELTVGIDGIPFMPKEPTDVPGTYRLTFPLVIDLPVGGVFELWGRWPGMDHDGDMRVEIYEAVSMSYLTIDPFTGYEYDRSVIDGPPHCEGNPSLLFDAIVASAREQPPYTPPSPETIKSIGDPWSNDVLYVEGGITYWLNERAHLIFDVPEGSRLVAYGASECADPGGCYEWWELIDEESGSWMSLDIETGERGMWYAEVTEEAKARGVDAVFDQIAASVRQHPPPPSCDNPATASDCAILLEARDVLAGDAELNWSADVSIHHWWGVTVDRWTGRVAEVHPGRRGLSGRIPAVLGQLSALKLLGLGPYNELTGEIPPELGQLSELETLYLASNRLTGEIPPEIGELPKLRELNLDDNLLEGCIPETLQQRFWGYMGRPEGNPGLRNCEDAQ